jgi:high-affinity nickel-transport protein
MSIILAVLIGGIETLGRIIDTFKREGPFWEMIGSLNDNFGALADQLGRGLSPTEVVSLC